MLKSGLRTSLAVALVCAALLVNGPLVERAEARALEDPAPAARADEAPASPAAGPAAKLGDKLPDASAEPADGAHKKLASTADGAEAVKPAGADSAAAPAPAPAEGVKKEKETSQATEQAARADGAAVKDEKDLKTLLESKNDAENDLTGSATASKEPAVLADKPSEPKKSATDDEPVSVAGDGSKAAPTGLDNDRFHYSLGDADKTAESDRDGALSKAGEADKADGLEANKQKPADSAAGEEPAAKPSGGSGADKADSELEPKKDSAAESSTTNMGSAKPLDELPAPKGPEPAASVTAAPPVDSKAEDKSTKPEPEGGSGLQASEDNAKNKDSGADAAVAPPQTPPAAADAAADKSTGSELSSQATVTASERPAPTTTPAPTSVETSTSTTAAPSSATAKSDEPKVAAESPPQAAASPPAALDIAPAAAAAAGAAAGSALGTALAGKDKPPASSTASTTSTTTTTTTTTTTRAPLSTRKSITNRWNSWPSTSSTPAPTRRRPILPSIRRRFRPYNVFPWAMPESYSPFDSGLPDAEPDFGLGGGSGSAAASTTGRPKRRSTTTTTTTVQPSRSAGGLTPSKHPLDEAADDDGAPVYHSRRRLPSGGSGGKRRHHHHHRHHYHPDTDLGSGTDFGMSFAPPLRPHHHRHNGRPRPDGGLRPRKHSDEQPPLLGADLFPGAARPLSPGFGLFNSVGGSSSSTGSGFDLLNPFSWLDEMAKPRPSLHSNNPRPTFESRPPRTHIGSAGRPSGERPLPVEGEFNDNAGASRRHDYHHDYHHHRPHGRPPGPSRDDEYDNHDCHGHGHGHELDHEHEHEHEHDRPRHRPPYRPSSVGRRPGRDEYDGQYGGRPDRPYGRRDGPSESGRETESALDRPAPSSAGAGPADRVELESSAATSGPRRVPASVFSPFDTLFGSLDDDLFGGGLRSSFIDSPLKAAAETIRNKASAFDAIISSPKISLPSSLVDQSPASGGLRKQQAELSGVQDSDANKQPAASVVLAQADGDGPAAMDSTGR